MPGRDSKRNQYGNYGYANGRGGGAPRNHVIPNEPPYTAYIGNAPDSMVQGDFEAYVFVGLKIKQVRLVRDRQTDRFRGFAYVDFEDADSLRRAIELDGTCVNDRAIRIDVAARPLGAAKPEGFRNKPDFESRDARRQPSGQGNNRYNDGYQQGGRGGNHYYQQEAPEHVEDGYHNEYNSERNRRSSGSGKTNERRPSQSYQHKTPPRKVSNNDDVFIGPDTPTSNVDGTEQTDNDQGGQTIARQQSRNWADCPIDESVTEPSPPPSANNTLSGDDFQVVRNKNPKPRSNQQQPSAARSMGNPTGRGRNHRGGPPQMAGGGRGYYEQIPAQYINQSQQFYHHQQAPPPLHMGLSYHQNNNPNRQQQQQQQPTGGSRQRLNSNRSNSGRNYNENNERPKKTSPDQVNEVEENSAPAENRPRLQLLPRSQKLSSSTDDIPAPEPAGPRNSSIFGCGKPRDERDPKLAELNKHIEEVVEKEQQIPRTKSTTSNGSTENIVKPVRILTAATESLLGH